MARLYGQLVEAFGFREVREASLVEVHDQVAHWNEVRSRHPAEEPPEAIDLAPRAVTEEQWAKIAEAEETFAEVNFRRNPLA